MSKLASLIFYLSVYGISAIFLYLSKRNKDKKIDLWFVLSIIMPVILATLRSDVGTDFESYGWMFEGQAGLPFTEWLETNGRHIDGTPFGIWLISQIAHLFDSREVFFGLLSLCVILPVFLFIKKDLSKDVCFLSAFLFLTGTFTTGLNITKQCVAIAFVIFGMRYVFARKPMKFLISVLCAYCFHPSALVAVFIYFLWMPSGMKYSVKRLVIIVLTILFVISISKVLENIGGRFGGYTEEVTGVEFNNKTFYVDLIWCALFMLFRKNFNTSDGKNDLFITMLLIGLIMSVSGFVSPYIKRIAMYYTFPQMFLIAQTSVVFKRKDRAFVNIMIFAYAITMFVISFYVLEQADIIPYSFVTRSVI